MEAGRIRESEYQSPTLPPLQFTLDGAAAKSEESHWQKKHEQQAQKADDAHVEKKHEQQADKSEDKHMDKTHEQKADTSEKKSHFEPSSKPWLERAKAVFSPNLLENFQGTGTSAPLDEDGYLSVLKTESGDEMNEFIERVAESLRLKVRDQGAFDGLTPHYSGEKASQSYFLMKQELIAIAAKENTWLVEDDTSADEQEQETQGNWFLNQFRGHVDLNEDSVDWVQKQPMNEKGYMAVAQRRNNSQMGRYIKRVLADMGPLYVCDLGQFHGFLKFYSGTKASQTFAQMRYELIGAIKVEKPWVASGETSMLTEAGYQAVASIENNREMAKFFKRVAWHHGCTVLDHTAMMGVVPHYSGRAAVQTLAALEKEVKEACNLTHDESTYGSFHDVVGKTGVLQLRVEGTTRAEFSAEALHAAGIQPKPFMATVASKASKEQLDASCPLRNEKKTSNVCAAQERKLNLIPGSFGAEPGCRTKVEQAITDSHRRALMAAMEREDNWTAIIEDDVVPLHPGIFDSSFKAAWEKMPAQSQLVRLSWCTFEKDLGSIAKKTFADTGHFRLVHEMTWADKVEGEHYYTGGCTTGYMVHKSFIPELLNIFPCCCPIDCCMERQLFYAPAKKHPKTQHGFRGEQIMMNMDAWDSKEDSMNYTTFNQGGVFVQDNRDHQSARLAWMSADSD